MLLQEPLRPGTVQAPIVTNTEVRTTQQAAARCPETPRGAAAAATMDTKSLLFRVPARSCPSRSLTGRAAGSWDVLLEV